MFQMGIFSKTHIWANTTPSAKIQNKNARKHAGRLSSSSWVDWHMFWGGFVLEGGDHVFFCTFALEGGEHAVFGENAFSLFLLVNDISTHGPFLPHRDASSDDIKFTNRRSPSRWVDLHPSRPHVIHDWPPKNIFQKSLFAAFCFWLDSRFSRYFCRSTFGSLVISMKIKKT